MRVSRVSPFIAAALCCVALPLSAAAPTVSPVDAEDHVTGSTDARITIVEYGDLECPFCARAHQTMEALLKAYDGDVRLVLRHYPLSFHPNAYAAALTAECIAAKKESAFWTFVKTYYENQGDDPVEVATKLGYDVQSCVEDGTYDDRVARDQESGEEAGVTGTPMFYVIDSVGGVTVSYAGAQEYKQFASLIDSMLNGDTTVEVVPTPAPTPAEPESAPIRPYNKRTEYLRGRPTARFVIVEFGNLSEAFTPKLHTELKKLLLKRTDTAWAMRTTDLAFLDRNGLVQSQAAMCAGAQKGRYGFWRMVDIILAKHKLNPDEKMDRVDLQSLAERLGFTGKTFAACMEDKTVKAQIDADVKEGEQYQAAPVAVIVDTRTKKQYVIQGAMPMQSFYDKIEEILAQD